MILDQTEKFPQAKIGVLGGTGLYEVEGIEDIEEVQLKTPFGKPSDAYVVGILEGKTIAFLSRHGRKHRILPSDMNYQANIYGFKMLGVERLISINSVGSLRENVHPRDIVLPDQFFDRTRRNNSFFGGGIAAHVSFAHPVCSELSHVLVQAAEELNLRAHRGGTYICIEGPAFSSIAESNIFRSWGCDVIGMTGATESKLCVEAEICYASMSLVCDYDAWHEEEAPVTIEMILENMRQNIDNAKALLKKTIAALPSQRSTQCGCDSSLQNCIVTSPDSIPQNTKEKLRYIIGKYIK
jgi:5'-methylthioadenosine phosphorylase